MLLEKFVLVCNCEIVNFTLTSKKKQYENLDLNDIKAVELANPMSENISIFKTCA